MIETTEPVQYSSSQSFNGLSQTSSTSSMPQQMTDSILDLASGDFLTIDADDILNNDVIMDKIRKISRLQETINDISTKIKTIDVNKNNYYGLQATTTDQHDAKPTPLLIIPQIDDLSRKINDDHNNDLILNETFCDYNQFFETNTDLDLDSQTSNENSKHVNMDSDTNDTYDYEDDDDEDEEVDDDLQNIMQYKQAQPISRLNNYSFVNKYRYLHPIDELDETELNDDDDDNDDQSCLSTQNSALSLNIPLKHVNNSHHRKGNTVLLFTCTVKQSFSRFHFSLTFI
jgi:hypothetical protein